MEGTTVRIELATASEQGSRLVLNGQETAFGAYGYDRVEVLIAPNRGEATRG